MRAESSRAAASHLPGATARHGKLGEDGVVLQKQGAERLPEVLPRTLVDGRASFWGKTETAPAPGSFAIPCVVRHFRAPPLSE